MSGSPLIELLEHVQLRQHMLILNALSSCHRLPAIPTLQAAEIPFLTSFSITSLK